MLSSASLIGRTHRLLQQNRQDVALTGAPAPGVAFGLALDGCGSKQAGAPSASEVGAALLGQTAAAFLTRQLAHPAATPLLTIQALHRHGRRFLTRLAADVAGPAPADRARFVATHLLATLLGFVVTPETAVFFWQGDGHLLHNGQVTTLDSDNRPAYLAYSALPGSAPQPHAFHTHTLPRIGLRQIAVATDGWHPAQLMQLEAPLPSLQLQRWLNQQAQARGLFDDDGAIAIHWPASAEDAAAQGAAP